MTATFLSPVSQIMHAAWDIACFVALGAAIDLLAYVSARPAARRTFLGLTLFAAVSSWGVCAPMADWLVQRAHHTLDGRHVLLLAAVTCGMGLAPTVNLLLGHLAPRSAAVWFERFPSANSASSARGACFARAVTCSTSPQPA